MMVNLGYLLVNGDETEFVYILKVKLFTSNLAGSSYILPHISKSHNYAVINCSSLHQTGAVDNSRVSGKAEVGGLNFVADQNDFIFFFTFHTNGLNNFSAMNFSIY